MEFSQLFKAHSNLRSALLEKMPPMQISRVSNQNSDYAEDNDGNELIENGIDGDNDSTNNKIATSDSVCKLTNSNAVATLIVIIHSISNVLFSILWFEIECLIGFTRKQ